MTEGHSIQPGSGGTVSPATGPEQHRNNNKNIQINNNNNNNNNNKNNNNNNHNNRDVIESQSRTS